MITQAIATHMTIPAAVRASKRLLPGSALISPPISTPGFLGIAGAFRGIVQHMECGSDGGRSHRCMAFS